MARKKPTTTTTKATILSGYTLIKPQAANAGMSQSVSNVNDMVFSWRYKHHESSRTCVLMQFIYIKGEDPEAASGAGSVI